MDAKQIAKGIVDGLSSVPGGMYYGFFRTWEGSGLAGSQLRERNQRETERFIRLIRSVASKEDPVRRLITLIMTDFYKKLDDKGKTAINNKIAYGLSRLGSKTGAQFALAYTAGSLILRKASSAVMYREFMRFSISVPLNVLMFQGLLEEAAQASRRMQFKYPQTYFRVSKENLDMVYFLVERQLEPYLNYINSPRMICKGIENELYKIISG